MSGPKTPQSHGQPQTIARGRVALRHGPSTDAVQDNELLFGEVFTVFEREDGWAYGQTAADNYPGYIHTIACDAPLVPSHRVTALSTPLLSAPNVKSATRDLLPLGAQVKSLEQVSGFLRVAPDGYVFAGHLAPVANLASDWVATAERFVGAPYVWGGKTHMGIDCSGLVQIALRLAGIAAPRDTEQQETALGQDVPHLKRQRGDLVFWMGHVGIMLDEARLIHANAYHMQVEIERLDDAIARIAPVAGPVVAVKRL